MFQALCFSSAFVNKAGAVRFNCIIDGRAAEQESEDSALRGSAAGDKTTD